MKQDFFPPNDSVCMCVCVVHQHSESKCLGVFTEPISKLTFLLLNILSFILGFCHFITIAKTEGLI